MQKLIDALIILGTAVPNGMEDDYPIDANHDIIYSHVGEDEIPEDSPAGQKLIALGWFINSDVDCWSKFV